MTAVNITDIKAHANVIAACGTKVGDVDHLEGSDIKLTKHGDGKHHLVPTSWVAELRDGQVILNKDAQEVTDSWVEV